MTLTTSLFSLVEADLQLLAENLKTLVGARHPILYAAADHKSDHIIVADPDPVATKHCLHIC